MAVQVGDTQRDLLDFRAVWRAEIAVRILELERRLAAIDLPTEPTDLPGHRRTALAESVQEALRNADAAIREDSEGEHHRRWRIRDWWTGTTGTAAWEYVFQAEKDLIDLERDKDLRAWLPRLLCWIQDVMPADPSRKRYEQELTAAMEGKGIDRPLVRQAYCDAIIGNNRKHANIRELRNRVALTTGILAITLAIIAVWHALNPSFISMCGPPQPASQERRCVSGSDSSQPADVAEVELVGALGGLLSIAFSLGNTSISPSRTSPRFVQWLLKPVAGAATALIGVLAIQSEVVIAPAGKITESLLLAYAAVFGFSQQLFTQYVDKRASKLLREPAPTPKPGAPGEETEGQEPPPLSATGEAPLAP